MNSKKKRSSFRYGLKKKKEKKLDESEKENIPSRLLTKIEMVCFEPAKIAAELLWKNIIFQDPSKIQLHYLIVV